VSSVLTTLATDVDDPVERLLAVSGGMKLAKEQFKLIGADTLQNWTEFAAPAVLGRAARIYSRVHAAGSGHPNAQACPNNGGYWTSGECATNDGPRTAGGSPVRPGRRADREAGRQQ
jgi:hypothetical protein